MSYSYVKTVFPNFNYSNVYDTKLYDDLNKNNAPKQLNIEPHDTLRDIYYIDTQKQKENIVLPETTIETFQNNQKFYNIPLPTENVPLPTKNISLLKENVTLPTKNINHIEHFEKDLQNSSQSSHNDYTAHVLDCSSCKELLLKQFNIESDRIRNEEIMELISFIIFGIFILLLLDKSNK